MTFGAREEARPVPVGHVAIYLVGVAGLAFCMTLLWLGMRAVMDLGGFCASGGPYEIAVECPDAVVASTPLSIFGGLASVGLMLWGGAALGAAWMGLVFLAWPALFLSLGWNFLAYGFFPPDGGWIWSWIFCGVLFVLMGAVPLIGAIGVARDESDGSRAYASGRVVVRPRPAVPPPEAPPNPDPAPGVRAVVARRALGRSPRTTRCDAPPWRPDHRRIRGRQGRDAGRSRGRIVNDGFQPAWLRVAVVIAVVVGIVGALWLFGVLTAPA